MPKIFIRVFCVNGKHLRTASIKIKLQWQESGGKTRGCEKIASRVETWGFFMRTHEFCLLVGNLSHLVTVKTRRKLGGGEGWGDLLESGHSTI